MLNCIKCQTEFSGAYCATCGSPKDVRRFDYAYILHEVQHALHLEKGFFYTVKELFVKPGSTISGFIAGNRLYHIKPFPFLILTSLFFTLTAKLVVMKMNTEHMAKLKDSTVSVALAWTQANWAYSNIIISIFIAFYLRLLFRKSGYNLIELLIMLTYLTAQSMLILGFSNLLQYVFPSDWLATTLGIIPFLYIFWGMWQFFDKKNFSSMLSVLLSYFLGSATVIVLMLIICFSIDAFLK